MKKRFSFRILALILTLSSMLMLSGCEGFTPPDYGGDFDPCYGQGFCPDGNCMWGGVCAVASTTTVEQPPSISPAISDIFINEDSSGNFIDLNGHDQSGDNELGGWAFVGADPNMLTITIGTDNLANIVPVQDASGQTSVTFILSDIAGLSAQQTISVFIKDINDAPVITSSPVSTATVGQQYSYSIAAVDNEGDALIFGLTRRPSGMTIDGSGTVLWTPTSGQVGTHEVTVKVKDRDNADNVQKFQIVVS